MGEDAFAVGRDGNALDDFGDGNHGDKCALFEVKNADAASVDVGRVGTLAVGCDHEHVGFDGAGGDFTDDLPRVHIDHVDGLRQFGADVQQSIGAKSSAMWADRFAKGDIPNDL